MTINVTGRHVEVTDTLREHILGKLEAGLADFPRIGNVHVVLNLEKHRHIAEIVTQVPHHGQVESKVEKTDMYAAIDEAIEHTLTQLRKWADRVHDHKGREGLGKVDKSIQRGRKG